MKKIRILAVICLGYSFMFSQQLPNIPLEEKFISKDNGGLMFAIDAYQDGVGIMVLGKLGYNIDNIIYFTYTKHKTVITKKDVLFMKKIINKVKISLEELQGKYKVVHYNTIKYIK